MKSRLFIILTFSLLLISCREKLAENKPQQIKKSEVAPVKQKPLSFKYQLEADSLILEAIGHYEYLNNKNWERHQTHNVSNLKSKHINNKENQEYLTPNNSNKNIDLEIYTSGLSSDKVIITEQINSSVKKITEYYSKDNEFKLVIEKEQLLGNIIKENHYYYQNNKIIKQITNHEYNTVIDSKQFENLEKTLSSKLNLQIIELEIAQLKSQKVISFE